MNPLSLERSERGQGVKVKKSWKRDIEIYKERLRLDSFAKRAEFLRELFGIGYGAAELDSSFDDNIRLKNTCLTSIVLKLWFALKLMENCINCELNKIRFVTQRFVKQELSH